MTNVGGNVHQGIRMAMVLPLLPNNLVPAGRAVVTETLELGAPAGNRNQVDIFVHYLYRQWANIDISIHREEVRTNNSVESFHGRLLRSIGRQHPNIWMFVIGIQKIEHSLSMDFVRLRRGEEVPIRRRPEQVRLNRQIGKDCIFWSILSTIRQLNYFSYCSR